MWGYTADKHAFQAMTHNLCKSNTYLSSGRVRCGFAKKREPLALSRREACPGSAVCNCLGLNLRMHTM